MADDALKTVSKELRPVSKNADQHVSMDEVKFFGRPRHLNVIHDKAHSGGDPTV